MDKDCRDYFDRKKIINEYAAKKTVIEWYMLRQMSKYSFRYGRHDSNVFGMEPFKEYLEDVAERGFDHIEKPLINNPNYYDNIFDNFATSIEDYFCKRGVDPRTLEDFDAHDFLYADIANKIIICDFIYQETAKDFLKWLKEKGK